MDELHEIRRKLAERGYDGSEVKILDEARRGTPTYQVTLGGARGQRPLTGTVAEILRLIDELAKR